MPLLLKIMAQDAVKVDQEVRSVSLPSPTGELGILPKRQQILVRLQKGNIRYETLTGEKQSLSVTGGIAYNDGENVTILLK
jgi:F-type H+-transporting ATPase subunit epsilon